MANQGYDTRDGGNVLFSYTVPDSWYKRQVTLSFIWIVALFAVLIWSVLPLAFRTPHPPIAIPALLYVVILLRNRSMRKLVLAIEGSTSGLQFQTYGVTDVCRVEWCEVKSLERRKHSRLTLQNGTVLNLALIPAEILDQLVMILQETSNARITGF